MNPRKPRNSQAMQPLELTIIIVNYNVKYFLEQCLHSVLRATEGTRSEIFVVDNNSSDDSRTWLEPRFPMVNFRWNNTNEGFAKASNSVLKESRGEYILFLNPDTLLPEDCLISCLQFFKAKNDCGALGVKMVDGKGIFLPESKRSFPSPSASFYKLAGLARIFPRSRFFAAYYAGHLDNDKTSEVDVLAGAFMMLRKKVIEQTGAFDESFFMYGEDVDLSYRILKSGHKNYYFPLTTIIHFKGESTQKLSKNYSKHFYGAMKHFVSKHYKDQKLLHFLMQVSITGSSLVSRIKALLMRDKDNNTTGYGVGPNTAVMANQADFDQVIQLLKYANKPLLITGRIDPGEQNLRKVLKSKKTRRLVFCEASISFKSIIEKVQQVNSHHQFLFHAKGSDSIIGSTNKNARGFFIVR